MTFVLGCIHSQPGPHAAQAAGWTPLPKSSKLITSMNFLLWQMEKYTPRKKYSGYPSRGSPLGTSSNRLRLELPWFWLEEFDASQILTCILLTTVNQFSQSLNWRLEPNVWNNFANFNNFFLPLMLALWKYPRLKQRIGLT